MPSCYLDGMLLNIFLIRSAKILAVSLRKLFEGCFPEKNNVLYFVNMPISEKFRL
jgi:hypothetical protein